MKVDETLFEALEKALSAGVTDTALDNLQKNFEKVTTEFEEDLMMRLRGDLASNLAEWVAGMAQRAVEAMLAGNEHEMRRYLSCDKRGEDGQYIGWTGRSDGYGNRRDNEWHQVIHGELFEQGAVALRKQVASANEAVLRDERIRDLEDQVKSLVAQVNKANAEKEGLAERFRSEQ